MVFGYYLVSLAYWLAGWLVRAAPAGTVPSESRRTASAPLLGCLGLTLTFSFIVQLQVIATVAASQDILLKLPPLPLIGLDSYVPAWAGEVQLLLAGIQCAVLAGVYRELRDRTIAPAAALALALTCLAMVAAALLTGSTNSFDIYSYVGLGHLGAAAYDPPATPLPREFSAVNTLWGVPLYPSPYGPVWIVLSTALVKLAPGLGAQLELFRILGGLAFGACICLLRALDVRPALVSLFALNPAVVEQFIASGHNDLVPLAFCLAALLAVRRTRVVAAVFLAAAAGATKLPFVLIAALAFTPIAGLRRRLIASATAGALAVAVTLAASRGHYFSALGLVAGKSFSHPFDLPTEASYVAAAAAAVAALAIAFFRLRFNPLASWSLVALSLNLYPWYLAWCLPYALLEGSFFPQFLIALPAAAFFLTDVYSHVPFVRAAYALVALAPLAILVAQRRRAALQGTGLERKS